LTDTTATRPKRKGSEAARSKISRIVESWFLTDPLLFVAWTMHEAVANESVATIRVARGKVEFNPEFIHSVRRDDLRNVLVFEATRILLGHPYARRQPRSDLSYSASNITIQECLRTPLPMPFSKDVFGDASLDHQYFEFYYNQLAARADESPPPPSENKNKDEPKSDHDDESSDGPPTNAPSESESEQPESAPENASESEAENEAGAPAPTGGAGEGSGEGSGHGSEGSPASPEMDSYVDPTQVGTENAGDWDADDLFHDEIITAIGEAEKSGQWGTLPGTVRERLLATLRPPLDYRGVLRNFRQSVLSVDRRLTRMKPSRRYGFAQMGSRYDFSTRLLLAVDVSGSMSHRELREGFSVANQFFKYGIREIDVVWFDTKIHGEPISLRRARSSIEIKGRGGTDFRCVIDLIDEKRNYDGAIIFTDGLAPKPRPPNNRRTKLMWLFSTQAAYNKMHRDLADLGRSAFIKPSAVPIR